MNLWLPVTHWTNSKYRHAYVHFGLPSCRGRCLGSQKHVRNMAFTHLWNIFFETSTKTQSFEKVSDFEFDSTAMPRWFQTHLPHWHFRWDGCSTPHTLVQNPQDVDMEETSRATEKTTWCKVMQISWLFGKISVKHVFLKIHVGVGQCRTT